MTDNKTNNKRIAKNAIFLYMRMFFVMVVSLYTSRVVLSTLGETDYGLYNVVGGVVTAFTFVSLAMSNSSARFITFALGKGNFEGLRKVFNSALLVHFVVAIVFLLIAETVGLWFLNTKMTIPTDRMIAANWVYQFSIITAFLNTVCVPYNSLIIAHEHMNAFAYISIFDVIMRLVVVFLLLWAPFDKLSFYASLLMIIQILDLAFYLLYCKKKFPESKIIRVRDFELIKSMGLFAGWSIIGNLSFVCYTQGLNIILNLFFGPVVNAARGIAVQVQSAVKQFITNFQTAINPQITKSYAEGELARMRNLLYIETRYSYYILLLLILPIIIEAKFILALWLVEVPSHTVSFVRLLLMVTLLDSFERPLTIAMNATGDIKKYQIITCTIQLFILPISYIFLKMGMPPEIVFIIQFALMLISCFPEFIILAGYIKLTFVEYFRKVILNILSFSVIALFLPLSIKVLLIENTYNSIIIIIVSLLSVVISCYTVGMTKSEKEYVVQIVRNKLKR